MKLRLRRDSRPWKILKYLLIGGGFLLVATIAPAGGAQIVRDLIRGYFRKKRFEREKFLRDLKNLQERKLVDYQELPDGKVKIILTKVGKQRILEYNIDDIKLNKDKKWDGKWRMVIFDIPDYKNKYRDAFRKKLELLGFYSIQESVFIAPYECEKEIDFIGSFYNIRNYSLIFYISSFEGEEKLKSLFKIH